MLRTFAAFLLLNIQVANVTYFTKRMHAKLLTLNQSMSINWGSVVLLVLINGGVYVSVWLVKKGEVLCFTLLDTFDIICLFEKLC